MGLPVTRPEAPFIFLVRIRPRRSYGIPA